MKKSPMQHQIKAYEKSDGWDGFAYFEEMGLGKTFSLLWDAERAFARMDIEVLFVLAPKGVYLNWANKEIPELMSCPHDIYVWNSGLTENQQERIRKGIQWSSPRLKVILMNIEGLISKHTKKFAMDIVKNYSTMCVLDESTTIRHPGSKRTQACLDLGEHAKFKRILTGSPIANSVFDIYAQARFLNKDYLGFSSFLSFQHYYGEFEKLYTNREVFRRDENGNTIKVRESFDKVVGHKNLDHLNKKMEPWSFRCLKSECLDLPDKIFETFHVELTKEQKKAYNEMLSMWLVEVSQGSVTATLALTRSMKMHHILCGYVRKDDGSILPIPHNRTNALLEVLEGTSEKVIIWANFRRDIEEIVAALTPVYGKESIVQFHGGIEDDEREIAKDRFQNDEKCRFWVGTTKAGGRGNTLTAASFMVFYSYDYDRELRIQAEDRAHRIGQKKHLTIVDLVALGTIDELILKSHKVKGMLADEVLGDVKKLTAL